MTRKDFDAITHALHENRAPYDLCHDIGIGLLQVNERFNFERFMMIALEGNFSKLGDSKD